MTTAISYLSKALSVSVNCFSKRGYTYEDCVGNDESYDSIWNWCFLISGSEHLIVLQGFLLGQVRRETQNSIAHQFVLVGTQFRPLILLFNNVIICSEHHTVCVFS